VSGITQRELEIWEQQELLRREEAIKWWRIFNGLGWSQRRERRLRRMAWEFQFKYGPELLRQELEKTEQEFFSKLKRSVK
jgi:hypothetical protein